MTAHEDAREAGARLGREAGPVTDVAAIERVAALLHTNATNGGSTDRRSPPTRRSPSDVLPAA